MGHDGLGARRAAWCRWMSIPLHLLFTLSLPLLAEELLPVGDRGVANRVLKLPPIDRAASPRLLRLPSIQPTPDPTGVATSYSAVPQQSLAPAPPVPTAFERRQAMVANHRFDIPMSAYAGEAERRAAVGPPSLAELRAVKVPADVERRARGLLAEASELANRGALFAAHEEFLRVMRLVTQALDADLGRPFHAEALSAGLQALDEAQSFSMAGKRVEADIHLAGFIAGHHTPVLKGVDPLTLTPLLAMQRYYDYAYKQLTLAGNDEAIASETLYSLGRIETLIAGEHPESSSGGPKAIALFQAALSVDAKNSRAANELGVLLAQCGRLPEARDVLAHAMRTAPIPIAERNLLELDRQVAAQDPNNPFPPQAAGNPFAGPGPATAVDQAEALASRVQWIDANTFNTLPDHFDAVPPGTPLPTPAGSYSQPQPPPPAAATAPSAASSPTNAPSMGQRFQTWIRR